MTRRKSRQPQLLEFADLRGLRTRAYIRESTTKQAEADRNGPATQRAGILGFCAEFGLNEPDEWYFDKVSGRNVDGRTELQRVAAEASEFDVLLFWHTTRSFRNREDAYLWKRQLRRAGLTLVFTEQRWISGDPRTKTAEFIHEFIDEQRSDEQEMFLRRNLKQVWVKGQVNGSPALGYERRYGPPGDPHRGDLIIVPQGRDTVRAIWDLGLTGRYSHVQIATKLNAVRDAEGNAVHLSKRGRALTPTSVRDILHHKAYTGVTVWQTDTPDEEVRPGRHEAIVTPEEYERMQEISARRARMPGREPTRDRVYPFSRRTTCLSCGRNYVGDAGGKTGYLRMRHAFGECVAPRTIAWSRLDQQMAVLLAERFCLPDDWQQAVRRLVAAPLAEVDPGIQFRVKEIRRAQDKLAQLYQWSHVDEEHYQAERRKLDRELRDLDVEAPNEEPIAIEQLRQAGELLANLGALWAHPGVTMQTKKEFIEEAFDEIQLDELGIRVLTPSEALRPLVAVAEVGGFGAGDRIRTGDPLLGEA